MTELSWKAGDTPIVGEFLELHQACGLGRRNAAAAAKGLSGSLYCVTAKSGVRLVAMGRIVGDGGMAATLVDLLVAPDMRGQGIGRELVERLVAWCHEELPRSCVITAIPQPGSYSVYKSAGFEIAGGMALTLP